MQLADVEYSNGILNAETHKAAIDQIMVNGYVVFERVLEAAFITELLTDYMTMYEQHIQSPRQTFGKNHFRIFLPFRAPYNDERVIAHPLVLPLVEAVLGEDFVCHYFASNTAAPDSDYQPVHSDGSPLFPASDVKVPPYSLVLNIPLIDTTEANGPMEFWPGGTHYNMMPREQLERLATQMDSRFAVMPAGSIMLRDVRMWHRGTRNNSNTPRPNIALIYSRPWMDIEKRISIPHETYDGLSERAKKIFRSENIGGALDQSDQLTFSLGAAGE